MNWIAATIIAAFFQNLRFSLQKNLNKSISTVASTYVRFIFALPFAAILFFYFFSDFDLIKSFLANDKFMIFAVLASVTQIIFTFFLLYLFQFSNFVIGTSLSKTEVIQIVLLEFLILGDKLSPIVVMGILISTIGIIIFSVKDVKLFFKGLTSKTTLVGLLSGFLLGLSVVLFRGAALSLDNIQSNFDKALITLFFGLCIQSLILTLYLVIFEKKQFKKLSQNKFQCLSAGLCGFFATLSWFYAFTLIQGSMVRAIGQIELLFSYFSSKYFFKEKTNKIELFGILVFVSGVIIILLNR